MDHRIPLPRRRAPARKPNRIGVRQHSSTRRTGQWLRAQRAHSPEQRGILTHLLRALSTNEPARKTERRSLVARKMIPEKRRREPKQRQYFPLPEEVLRKEPYVFLGEREIIPRAKIVEIEDIITQQGLQAALMHIAHTHPQLAEMLAEPAMLAEFAKSGLVTERWKTRLLQLARNPKPDVRAIGILIYLQTVHRNPPEVEYSIQQMMRQN